MYGPLSWHSAGKGVGGSTATSILLPPIGGKVVGESVTGEKRERSRGYMPELDRKGS